MSPLEHYLKTAAEWQAAKSDMHRYIMLFRKVSGALAKDPGSVCFTGLPSASALSAEAVLSATEKIEADAWPSAARLQEAILRYVRAGESNRAAWAEVPEDQRTVLVRPD